MLPGRMLSLYVFVSNRGCLHEICNLEFLMRSSGASGYQVFNFYRQNLLFIESMQISFSCLPKVFTTGFSLESFASIVVRFLSCLHSIFLGNINITDTSIGINIYK